jgi:hypothetical protein
MFFTGSASILLIANAALQSFCIGKFNYIASTNFRTWNLKKPFIKAAHRKS